MFQQRLPTLDYDLAMYINTAPPDPSYLTTNFTCDQIPTEENGNQGGNTTGWCNEEASQALHDADAEVDEAARKELITTALTLMDEDHAVLPLVTYPKTGVMAHGQDRWSRRRGDGELPAVPELPRVGGRRR